MTVKWLQADRDEIERLQVYCVALMWPERPDDGEIALRTSPDSERMWHCAYNPTLVLIRKVRVFDQGETQLADVELDRLVVITHDE